MEAWGSRRRLSARVVGPRLCCSFWPQNPGSFLLFPLLSAVDVLPGLSQQAVVPCPSRWLWLLHPPLSSKMISHLSSTTAAYETARSLLPKESYCKCLCSLVCPRFLRCPDFSLGCPVAQRRFSLFPPKGLSARASVFLTVLAPCLEWPPTTTLFSWGNPICPTLTFIWFQFNKHLWRFSHALCWGYITQ